MANTGNDETKMPKTITATSGNPLPVEQWLQIRKEAGLRIDPETAEVMWIYALTLDPYDAFPDLLEEYGQVGREYFARSPRSDIWVWFGDLPDDTQERLLELHGSKLRFPAGLLNVEMRFGSAIS